MRKSKFDPIPDNPSHGDLWAILDGDLYFYDEHIGKWKNTRTGEEFTTFALKIIEKQIMNPNNPEHSPEENRLIIRAQRIELLEAYSYYLEKRGLLDTGWRSEPPFAIDEFLKTLK